MKSSVSQTVVVVLLVAAAAACIVLSLRLHVTTTATATATDTPTHDSHTVAAHKAFSEWLDVTQMHNGAPVSAATARVGDKLARQVRRLMGVHTRPFPTLRPNECLSPQPSAMPQRMQALYLLASRDPHAARTLIATSDEPAALVRPHGARRGTSSEISDSVESSVDSVGDIIVYDCMPATGTSEHDEV